MNNIRTVNNSVVPSVSKESKECGSCLIVFTNCYCYAVAQMVSDLLTCQSQSHVPTWTRSRLQSSNGSTDSVTRLMDGAFSKVRYTRTEEEISLASQRDIHLRIYTELVGYTKQTRRKLLFPKMSKFRK